MASKQTFADYKLIYIFYLIYIYIKRKHHFWVIKWFGNDSTPDREFLKDFWSLLISNIGNNQWDYLAHVIEALAKQRTVMSKHYLTTDTSHAQTALSCWYGKTWKHTHTHTPKKKKKKKYRKSLVLVPGQVGVISSNTLTSTPVFTCIWHRKGLSHPHHRFLHWEAPSRRALQV